MRLSESLAKMRLRSQVHAEDVREALRLFRTSTVAAASAVSTKMKSTTGKPNELPHSDSNDEGSGESDGSEESEDGSESDSHSFGLRN